MPEPPLSVDYANYYRRLFRQFLLDLFTLGSGQVIGVLLSIAILVFQIHYGLIPHSLTYQSFASVIWPYLILIAGLCVLSTLRAPAQLDAAYQGKITKLSSQLELPDKAQAEYIRGLVAKLSDNGKAVLGFALFHDEITNQQLSMALPKQEDVQKAYRECLDLGLLKWRNDCPDRTSPIPWAWDSYWVPAEFRIPLQRFLYEPKG